MPFEWIAAVRFLREGRMQSLLIIVGVGVGVAVIVFMSALLSGLQANLIKRTLSSQAHITLLPPEEIARPQQATDTTALRLQKQAQRLRAIDQWQTLRDRLETWPEIAAVSPVASGPAFAVRGEANKAITVVGIEPERYNRVISLAERLTVGQLRVGAGEAVIGIELAKDMVNDRGGLLGKPVQLVSVDNHGKPEDAVAAIQQLTVRHVSAIIGPDLADCTRAVIPNVEAVKIPLISPACTQPDITVDAQSHEVYRYIFRAAYIDASQGRAMADYALKQLHVKRAAVFYYPDKMYAQGLAEYFNPTLIHTTSSGSDGPFGGEVQDAETNSGKGAGASTDPMSARSSPSDEPNFDAIARHVQNQLTGSGAESMQKTNLLRHVVTRMTDEGLVIELTDLVDEPLFQADSAQPTPVMKELAGLLSGVLGRVKNDIALSGHVRAYPEMLIHSPVWALSDARAHTVRNLLGETGFNESRIQRVTAYADRRNRSVNPMDPNNNRIEVILLR